MSSMQTQPTNDGLESLGSTGSPFEDSKLEKEWNSFVALLHRETLRVHLERKESAIPVNKLNSTVIFIYDLENLLFPVHKINPEGLKPYETAIDGHVKVLDNLLKSNRDLSQYVFLLKQRLTKLRAYIIGFLL